MSQKNKSTTALFIFLFLVVVVALILHIIHDENRIKQLECDLGSRIDCVTQPILSIYSNRISDLNSSIDRESFLRQIRDTDNNIAKLVVGQNPKLLKSLEKFVMFSNYTQIIRDKNCSYTDTQDTSLKVDASEDGKIIGFTMEFWNKKKENVGYLKIGETQVDISITSKDCLLHLVYDVPTNTTKVVT